MPEQGQGLKDIRSSILQSREFDLRSHSTAIGRSRSPKILSPSNSSSASLRNQLDLLFLKCHASPPPSAVLKHTHTHTHTHTHPHTHTPGSTTASPGNLQPFRAFTMRKGPEA